MSNGPVPFLDIGKKAKDLLYKDYNFDHKFSLTTSSGSGLGLTTNGIKIGQVLIGDISTQYKSDRTFVDVKVDNYSNVSTTVTVNEVVTGLKTSLSFKLPDQKSGKLDMQYLHERIAINTSIGLTSTPLLELAASIGTKELSFGAEAGFDSASATLTKCNSGIGYNKHDFSAALLLTDKGETLRASYIHIFDPTNGAAVAAEMAHMLKMKENSFAIGSYHAVNDRTIIKTRFSDSGKVAVLCQHQWRPKSYATVSAEYDPKSVFAPSRVGLALALKP